MTGNKITFEDRKKYAGYTSIYTGSVTSKIILNPSGSKHFTHLSITSPAIAGKVMPGDYIGIFVENDPDDIKAILKNAGFSGGDYVKFQTKYPGWDGEIIQNHNISIEQALSNKLDIITPSTELLKLIASKQIVSPRHTALKALLDNDRHLKKYQSTHTLADVIKDFPNILTAQEVAETCYQLDQRRFTVSEINGEEIGIVESPIEYEINQQGLLPDDALVTTKRQGTFTRQLKKLEKGSTLNFYIDPSHFGLPWKPVEGGKNLSDREITDALKRDMIFVGPGTGIAACLTMMQELAEKHYQGKGWLITGNRCEADDTLYKEKLEHFKNKGILEKVSFAGSREPDGTKKYVQDVIRDNGKEIWNKLQSGAYFYICGDRAMEGGVRDALWDVCITHGGLSEPQARLYVKKLEANGRLQAHTYRQSLEFENNNEPQATKTDIAVIGRGVAGCSAAMYSARAGYSTLLLGEDSGQLMLTEKIENFPGFDEPVSTSDLMNKLEKQAKRYGAETRKVTVDKVDFQNGKPYKLYLNDGSTCEAQSVIVATGAKPKWLGVEGEARYYGKGVSSCALCDGNLFKGKNVVIVGGGDSAVDEALYLNRIGANVKLVHRGKALTASYANQAKLLDAYPPVEILWNSEIQEIKGDGIKVTGVSLRNTDSRQTKILPTDGIFIAIGQTPTTSLFKDHIALDNNGYITTQPGSTGTSIKGVFAAGECADPRIRQAGYEAGKGIEAGIEASRYLESSIGRSTEPVFKNLTINQNSTPHNLLSVLLTGSLAVLGLSLAAKNLTRQTEREAA